MNKSNQGGIWKQPLGLITERYGEPQFSNGWQFMPKHYLVEPDPKLINAPLTRPWTIAEQARAEPLAFNRVYRNPYFKYNAWERVYTP